MAQGPCLRRTCGGWCLAAVSRGDERCRPTRNGQPPGGFSQDGAAWHVPAVRRPAPPYITAHIAGPFAGAPVQYRAQCTRKCAAEEGKRTRSALRGEMYSPPPAVLPTVHCRAHCRVLCRGKCPEARAKRAAMCARMYGRAAEPRATVRVRGTAGPRRAARAQGTASAPRGDQSLGPYSECSASSTKNAPLGVPRGARAIRCARGYGRSFGPMRFMRATSLNLVNIGTYSMDTLEFSRPYQRAGEPAQRRIAYLSAMAVRS